MTGLAEGTEHFIWVPSRKPHHHGFALAVLGAVLISIACSYAIGSLPLPGLADAPNRKEVSTELSRTSGLRTAADRTLNEQTDGDQSRVEHQISSGPALILSSHSGAGLRSKRQSGPRLSEWSEDPLRRLRAKVAAPVDGEISASTEEALKAWQGKNGLTADGIAGPDTLMVLGLHDLLLLKRGTHGEAVKKLQQALSIGVDGAFGTHTQKAVRDYQKKHGLVADGMAGPATLAHLKLFMGVPADR